MLAALATTPLQAQSPQSNRTLMTGPQYTRVHDYDLIHQRIVLSQFNWESLSFEGSVTTTLASRRAGLDSIILDEGKLLTNSRIVDRSGQILKTSRVGDTLVIHPAHALRLNDTITFTVTYHGTIKSGDGLTFITNDGLPHRPDQIWSMGETTSNHYWFPTYDAPNDKMTWEMIVTVPKADLAISNGKLVSNTVTGSNRTMTWNQDAPSASYLVSLIVAPLALVHDSWEGIPVDYYTYHEDSTLAWPLFHVTTDMIGTYSKLTGVRYPWAKYAQTTVADFFGGMENVSATTLVDWLPDARAYHDHPWYQQILIPHELAHQWFGDYVTTLNWAHTWLNEGFAEFMPGQYWGEKHGARAEQDYYLDEYRQYQQIEERRSMPLASMGSNNIYPKGALVLEMLKDYLGADRFWASIHTYLVDHAFGNATSDDVRQAVLKTTGDNLDWFWDEWIYGAGLPQIVVKSTYDAAAKRVTLNVQQAQVDSFKVDSTGRLFQVPQAFRMPIVVRVAWQGGERRQTIEINAREQLITIDSVPGDPTMVVFDDGNRMLKALAFDQPVSWLVAELQHDDNLWDRQWAIAQLAQRPGDAAAVAALADAATHADYYLTRAAAVEALGDFLPPVATPPLTDATRDTSAAVRAAAIGAMGRVGGPTVASLARNLFEHDSSYAVRAAALSAFVQTDPAHGHDLLGVAIATPSYQDVIQSAAFQAIIQTNDTAFIAQVDGAMAQQEFPAHVLAVLGARGNAHAMSLLVGHLNDPRAGVRRYAVSAFANTMTRVDKNVALQQLKSAITGITYPDTRQEVTDLIALLEKP